MNYPPYPFDHISGSADATIYAFVSLSQQKSVQKVVFFTLADKDVYNMALVDLLDSGELSDRIVSDNQDMEKVLATVIQVLLDFLSHNTTATVTFQGSTPSRTRLYRILISNYLSDIQALYRIDGLTADGVRESFCPNQDYIAFIVSLF